MLRLLRKYEKNAVFLHPIFLGNKINYVQTNIQHEAPTPGIPSFRKQRLLALQLSGPRGGMQCAVSSHTHLRIGRKREHETRGFGLRIYHDSARDDAR